jgi:hypothetical protein
MVMRRGPVDGAVLTGERGQSSKSRGGLVRILIDSGANQVELAQQPVERAYLRRAPGPRRRIRIKKISSIRRTA